MRRSRNDGNDIDFSQRHAPASLNDDGWAIRALKQARPDWPGWSDPLIEKRLQDVLADVPAGHADTPAEEDREVARVRQESAPDDPPWRSLMPKWWHQTPEVLRHLRQENPYWAIWNDPEEMARFAEGMEGALPGSSAPSKKSARTLPPKPWQDDEFLNDPEKWNRMRRKL